MSEIMKFKIPNEMLNELKTTLAILPNKVEPPFRHYSSQDAFITRQTFCIFCWMEEEESRKIARSFGPKPRKKRRERKPPKQF